MEFAERAQGLSDVVLSGAVAQTHDWKLSFISLLNNCISVLCWSKRGHQISPVWEEV